MHADFYEQILTHICSAESIAGNTFLHAIPVFKKIPIWKKGQGSSVVEDLAMKLTIDGSSLPGASFFLIC